MSVTINDFKSNKVKYVKYVSTEKSVYFDHHAIYVIIAGDDQGVSVLDNNEQDYYLDSDEIKSFIPVTQEEFNEFAKAKKIANPSSGGFGPPSGGVAHKAPVLDFKDNTFPFWAKYIIISGNEISIANGDSLDTATKIKPLTLLGEDVCIPLPVTKSPIEILFELYQAGKINDDFLEKLVGESSDWICRRNI